MYLLIEFTFIQFRIKYQNDIQNIQQYTNNSAWFNMKIFKST